MKTLHAVAPRLSLSLLFVAACGGGGGGGPDASTDAAPDAAIPDAAPPDALPLAPPLYNEVDLPDDELADQAIALLTSEEIGGCQDCHGMTRQYLSYWRALSDEALALCLTDLDVSSQASAMQMIDCLRAKPQSSDSPFEAHKLGIFAAAAHLEWFEFTFERAYGAGYALELADFTDRVGMPKGTAPAYAQSELDIVATWILRGLPLMDEKLPDDPRPTDCTPGVSAAVADYVADRALTGWRAVNEADAILMHGCAGATTELDCLSSYPRAQDLAFGDGWESLPGATLRVLRTNDYPSSFWTRSSADGRFVAHGASGGGMSAAIVDLAEDRVIDAQAYYDPAFFPDNSGFVFQGPDAYLCDQSVLLGSPATITFDEPQCASTNEVGLYEHVGTSLNGEDYWAIDGQFVSDNGGHDVTRNDPGAWFGGNSTLTLTPMIYDGTTFVPGQNEFVDTPYEGDAVLSPSAGLVVSRVGGFGGAPLGFVLRRVDATPDGGGGFDIELPEIARYCIPGGKPGFSYDERWMVLHHYVGDEDAVDLGFTGPGDPAFDEYQSLGAANVYLVELATGDVTRITRMNPGQYALFPHFRSDGWIYFQVRNAGSDTEYVVASDAALMLEQ